MTSKKENSFLKNLEDKTKNPLLYCSKCREIPYVLLKTPTKVLVKCECFEEFKLVTVENFMEQLQDNSKKKKIFVAKIIVVFLQVVCAWIVSNKCVKIA